MALVQKSIMDAGRQRLAALLYKYMLVPLQVPIQVPFGIPKLSPKLQATGVASSEARGAWPSDQASPPIHVQGTDEERRNVALRRIRTPRVCW